MEENSLKDSYEEQAYKDIKVILKNLLLELFREMLDYKNISYVNEENNFEHLDAQVRLNYPQFSFALIDLSVTRNEPHHTYLDVIKNMLTTYVYLKKNYKDAEFEKMYFESNPNTGEDIVDDYDVID